MRADSFPIVPPMGTGSWAAFTPAPGGAMLMGDIVVLPTEIGLVQRTALEHGLHVTGLHNHFVRDEPQVMFMHVHGMGSTDSLARAVRAVFDRVCDKLDVASDKMNVATATNSCRAKQAGVGRHAFCRTRDMQIVALGNANWSHRQMQTA